MIQKHELMRARQSSMDAKSAIHDIGGIGLDELQTSFERWEIKLAQGEYITGDMGDVDVLEQEYVSQEQEASLKIELEALLSESKQENSDENA